MLTSNEILALKSSIDMQNIDFIEYRELKIVPYLTFFDYYSLNSSVENKFREEINQYSPSVIFTII